MTKAKMLTTLGLALGFGALVAAQTSAGTGNGLPSSGLAFNLQIIGVDHAKKPPLTGSNRSTIFMPLTTGGDPGCTIAGCPTEPDTVPTPDTGIYLVQGDFKVCDGNGFLPPVDCSGSAITGPGVLGNGATFQLPCDSANLGVVNSCATIGGKSASYAVYAAELGKPGGTVTMTTCALDTSTGGTPVEVCSTTNTVQVRDSGKPKWSNVTTALTELTCTSTTCPGACPSGTCTFNLFDPNFQTFLWDYDSNNNKHLQLRFYLL